MTGTQGQVVGGSTKTDRKEEFKKFSELEKHHIISVRKEGVTTDEDKITFTGLALSGGGIRSATFNLGVLQALSKNGLLRRLDYLSTVSGGGYIGASLTWFLSQKGCKEPGHDKCADSALPFGTTAANFPYGVDAPGKTLRGKDTVLQRTLLNYLRHRGNYLAPGNGITSLTLIGVVIRNAVINLMLWLSLLTVLILGVMSLGGSTDNPGVIPSMFKLVGYAGLGLVILFMTVGIVFAVLMKLAIERGKDTDANLWRGQFDRWGTHLLELCIALGIIYAVAWLGSTKQFNSDAFVVSGISVIAAIAAGTSGIFKPESPVINRILLPLASGFLAFGLLLLAFNVAYRAHVKDPLTLLLDVELGVAFICVSAAVAALVILFTNLNILSISRYYRDRLKEAYMPRKEEFDFGTRGNSSELYLKDIYQPDNLGKDPGPYPIINTNVILIDSECRKWRTRGGDSFILSPLFCGSDATGWQKTKDYNKGNLTLSTAMAISGAAINPNAGPGGQGITRNRVVSFLMSALNLRLGMWLPNPDERYRPSTLQRWMFPNFLAPVYYGVKSALGGRGYCEHSTYLQISDGGHFENLGLYELLRRELDLIIVSDASADPGFTFSDLRRALRYAEMDLDVEIDFDNEGDLSELMPAKGYGIGSQLGVAEKGYTHARIRYKSGKKDGQLFYLKSTMIKLSRVRTRSYKLEYPLFPDQTTADQFFEEAQFAAYRDLGYAIATEMIEHSKLYPLERRSLADRRIIPDRRHGGIYEGDDPRDPMGERRKATGSRRAA